MQDLTREAITTLLASESSEPKVTVYTPMHTSASPPHMTENQIRFKNLIHKAQAQLKEQGNADKLVEQLETEIEKRMGQSDFWESQTEGLLICAQSDNIQLFHLPIDTEEYVAIDTCYHLAPVLALLEDEQSFYVLLVTQHQPQLLAGSMYGLCQMEVDLPADLDSALGIDERNQVSQHTQAKGTDVSFNGRGGGQDPRENERLRFFRLIDSIVVGATEHNLPLILAGTDSDLAEYRSISKHHSILRSSISGSVNPAKAQHELYEPAYKIVQDELISTRRLRAIEHFGHLKGTRKDRIAEDPLEIAQAAKEGRIETLLITLKRNTTDTIRDTAKSVDRITFPKGEVGALINKAANAVANASGRIVNLDIDAVTGRTPMMAVLRY